MRNFPSYERFLSEGLEEVGTFHEADRKRVTAVLRFDKGTFQSESSSIAKRLRELGATEFQRVTGESNPHVEIHADFPNIHRLREFRESGHASLITESAGSITEKDVVVGAEFDIRSKAKGSSFVHRVVVTAVTPKGYPNGETKVRCTQNGTGDRLGSDFADGMADFVSYLNGEGAKKVK